MQHKTIEIITNCFLIPQRAVLTIMMFLGVILAFTMRVSFSLAITAMVIRNNHTLNEEAKCKPSEVPGLESSNGGEYDWSEQLQGAILSSFYWGYVTTQLPGGLLAEKFGGKYSLSFGILATAVFTLLTPAAIKIAGPVGLIIVRVLAGAGEGTTFPAISALLADWIPLKERSKTGSLVLGASQVGAMVANGVSGLLINKYKSWEVVFYFFGGVTILWFIVFNLLCYSNPETHPFIKNSEKEYLQHEIGRLRRSENLPSPPFKLIFKSAPVWAMIVGQIGHDWGFYIMVTDLPKYMADVLLFPIKQNGLFSTLPYVVMWCNSILTGLIADFLIAEKLMGITAVRKWYTVIASIFPGIFMVLASYAGCRRMLVVTLFTIAMFFMAFYYSGLKVNPIDLSPNYAGTLMAIVNTFGGVAGIVTPYFIGVLTPDAALYQWMPVFWSALIAYIASSIVYFIWASGETQPWNEPTVEITTEINKVKYIL